jgi:hypothetical protein
MTRDTLSEVQQWLGNAGFTQDLVATNRALRADPSGQRFEVADLVVAATYRFEGQSNPDDEAILFALATPAGDPVGTFTAPYGPMSSQSDEAIIQALHARSPSGDDIRTHTEHDHIAAVFTDREAAEAAVTELLGLGLGSEHLGVAIHESSPVAFEHDEEADLVRDVEVRASAGVPIGFIAGMALAALAVPGLGVLGIAGLFAVGAATGLGGAMLGGYLGVAAADRALAEHDEISHTPLQIGEVLVAVCSHGQPQAVQAVMQRHGGRLLSVGPVQH